MVFIFRVTMRRVSRDGQIYLLWRNAICEYENWRDFHDSKNLSGITVVSVYNEALMYLWHNWGQFEDSVS